MGVEYILQNKKSVIAVNDTYIKTVTKKSKSVESDMAIAISPNFQIELGRNIEDYMVALRKTRLPFVIQRINESGDISQYVVSRMSTGIIGEYAVVNIICKENIIMIVNFNRDLLRSMEYRKFIGLSLIQQLTIGARGNRSDVEYSNNITDTITTVLGIPRDKLKVLLSNKKAEVLIGNTDGIKKMTFVENNEMNKYYELSSIALRRQ